MTNYERDGLRTHYVYRLFDIDGMPLYVGMTLNVGNRVEQHRLEATFGGRIHRVEVTTHADLWTAAEVEREQIRALRPRHNIAGRGPRRDWSACDFYEVIEHHAAGAVREHSKTLPDLLHEFGLRFPDTAAATLPALGLALPERRAS